MPKEDPSIEKILKVLIGLPLQTTRRNEHMRVFGFGEIVLDPEGDEACEWALHVYCSWRLIGPEGIITGYTDLWEPLNEEDWREDWDYEEGNLQDKNVSQFMENSPYTVEDVRLKVFGDLEIDLSGGYQLQTFRNQSFGESWVFFRFLELDPFIRADEDGPWLDEDEDQL